MLSKYPTKRIVLFNPLFSHKTAIQQDMCFFIFQTEVISTLEFFLEEREQNYSALRKTSGVREKTLS